jgi:hypothetical protein
MNLFRLVLALLATPLVARGESFLETTITSVPAEATALVFVVDVVAPPEAPSYDDAPPLPQPQQPPTPKATADPSATAQQPPQPPQQRRRRNPSASKPPPAVRTEMKLSAPASTVTWRTASPTAGNLRIRVAAIKGDNAFPLVIASGQAVGLKTTADAATPVSLALAPPILKLAPEVPQTVAPGAKFTLAGTITDPGNFLGTKNRMRVFLNTGTPPAADRAGMQISTIDVTTKGDNVTFAFELTAPSEPGALYYQFGEISGDFVRADGTQAPFLVLPSTTDGVPLQLKIQRPTSTALVK